MIAKKIIAYIFLFLLYLFTLTIADIVPKIKVRFLPVLKVFIILDNKPHRFKSILLYFNRSVLFILKWKAMDRSKFERWITSETNRALRERDLGRVRILLSWYETKFSVELASMTFEYPFTNQLIAYHQIVKNQTWLNGLINEELAKSIYDGRFISVNTDWFNAGLNLDNSFIIIDPDSIPLYDNDSIIGGYLDEVNSIMQDRTVPFFIHEKRNIKFASGLLSIQIAQNLIATLEDEIQGFDRVIILSEPDFFLDFIYALELSAIKRRIEIVNLNHRAGIEKLILPNKMTKSFEERYGVGDYSDRNFFPFTLHGKEISVENPMITENPDVIESIAKMLTPVYRNSTISGVAYTKPYGNITEVDEDSIGISEENLIKQKLMISDNSFIDAMQMALTALNNHLYIMLLGETGVGKSLTAKTLHQLSSRKKKPFVQVNCATLSENLLDSELFGAVPGAYTGITKDGKKGKIEAANGGTLFLDEIFEAHPSIQAKLLTFLDDQSYMKVGGYTTEKADVRIIFATNRKLAQIVSDPSFREDFYQRISTFPVTIPPLRDRQDDIVNIFNSCFQEVAQRLNFRGPVMAPDTLKTVKELRWSGNWRQLIKTIERIVIYCMHKGLTTITSDLVLKKYEDIKLHNDLAKLELILEDFFLQWEQEKENYIRFLKSKGNLEEDEKSHNYLDGFIKPILAHLFVEKHDKNYSRKDVFKAIGMNAERTDSHLASNAKMYPLLRDYFSK